MGARSKKDWNKLTPAERAAEFDASHSSPGAYAMREFEPEDRPTTELRTVSDTGTTELPKRGKGRHKRS